MAFIGAGMMDPEEMDDQPLLQGLEPVPVDSPVAPPTASTIAFANGPHPEAPPLHEASGAFGTPFGTPLAGPGPAADRGHAAAGPGDLSSAYDEAAPAAAGGAAAAGSESPRSMRSTSTAHTGSASWRTGHSIPGLGHLTSGDSHLGSEFGECCEAHSDLAGHARGHATGSRGRRKRQRAFDQNKLLTGLRENKEDTPPPRRRISCGFPQVVLTVTMLLLLLMVLFCFVMSKLSLVVLTEAVRAAPASDGAHVAINMIILCIMIPQAWGLLLATWKHCYKAKRTNPSPTVRAVLWTLLDVLIESIGVSLFILRVATRVHAALVVVMLSAIFAVPAFNKVRMAWKSGLRRVEAAASDGEDDSLLDPDAGSSLNKPMYLAESRAARRPSALGRVSDIAALIVQGLAPVYIPVVMYFLDDEGDWETAVLAAVSLLFMSFSWLEAVQLRRVTTGKSFGVYTARVKSSLFGSAFRLLFTTGAIAVIVAVDPSLDSAKMMKYGLTHLGDKDLVWPFVTQVVFSFVGYNLARMACIMDMQAACFAFPLTFATPVTLGLILGVNQYLPWSFKFEVVGSTLLWPTVGVAAAVWLSSVLINRRTAWNTKMPRLALDETLFFQPTFNGIFLEQYTLLNRRPPQMGLYRGEPVISTKEQLKKSRIFICTTMYHEDEKEMRQLLRSLMQVDAEIGATTCEAHIWMDGGIVNNSLGKWALQLMNCIDMEVQARKGEFKEKYKDQNLSEDWIQTGQRVRTPYGERIEWELPLGRMPFVIHLKDATKVKAKKRWSQCMYMYYLCQFRCPKWDEHRQLDSDVTNYVLTTDADVKFKPSDVLALLMQCARDQRVGAVCARTHPMGSGPLVWYQIFDYAIGHWFQKTAEHVLGTVLCCPGCFSLYRLDALRDVLLTYSSSVQEANQFLTKDMGEDRWLCTILVLAGWRLDYCAAATDYTYCPVDFNEFFNQRRRWIPSTLANIMELLADWRTASRNNDSISLMFILYQAVMLFSAVVCPGTVLLIMIGGIRYSMSWPMGLAEGMLFTVTIVFMLICLYTPSSFQLLVAKIFTVLFALLMGAVFIGVAAEVADEIHKQTNPTTTTAAPHTTTSTHRKNLMWHATDAAGAFDLDDVISGVLDAAATTDPPGIAHSQISVSTVYLAAIIAMFLLAGVFHLSECLALVHGVWYLLCLPGGYLFLLIYSFCNLNDRSWGTRVAYVEKKKVAATGGLLAGCGRFDGEGLAHFIGRALCCRLGIDPPPDDEPESPYAVMAARAPDEEIEWELDADSNQAKSRSVTALQDYIRDASNQVDILHLNRLTKSALEACPELGDFGVWTQQWDRQSMTFAPQRVGPLGLPTDRRFLEQMLSDIDQVITGSDRPSRYAWGPMNNEEPVSSHSTGDVKLTGHFLQERGLASRHMQEVLVRNGYEDTTFLVDLDKGKLEKMGLHKTLTSKTQMKRLLAEVKKLPRDHIPKLIPVNLLEWLRALRLARYDTHFERFGYKDGDLSLVVDLQKPNLTAMGITTPAHVEKFLLAIKELRALFGKGHVTEDNRQDRSKKSIYHARQMVGVMEVCSIEASVLAPLHIFETEATFWHSIVEAKLDPKLEPISNLTGLKDKLEGLRNMVVMTVFIINAMWLVLMLNLATGNTNNLQLLNSNPLGLLFLLIYGGIFVIQFLTLIAHRFSTALQILSNIQYPWGQQLVDDPSEMGAITPVGSISADSRRLANGIA